ncbi:hypothetical protein GWI33_020505 [Rhynchophorus ferrugineus]|uniref:10 kDa heat shock protein, mitochondrial n=1 Tax=Rhynchophorus ferrugineus TaxID=354439 RepID=A0A834HPC4_RHYFE|nr:hypothetical protein GWI33_020505 [Rhynchophorus ferrugineus]
MSSQAAAIPKSVETVKKLIPLFNRILVKRADPPKESKGGIVLPDNSKTKILRATVIAVGPGTRTERGEQLPMCVKPGDEVLLPDYSGTKVQLDESETYFMFRESEILAKFE